MSEDALSSYPFPLTCISGDRIETELQRLRVACAARGSVPVIVGDRESAGRLIELWGEPFDHDAELARGALLVADQFVLTSWIRGWDRWRRLRWLCGIPRGGISGGTDDEGLLNPHPMKNNSSHFLLCVMMFCSPLAACAAVIQTPGLIAVAGVINGDGSSPPGIRGDTLDYLKFEVLTTSSVTVTSGFGSGFRLLLAQFIGRNDEFGFIGNPFYLEQTSSTDYSSLIRSLDAGVYVAVMNVADNTSYDIFDGFVAVNPEGGGFTNGPYGYSIAGDVRALEFWDGELDGSFIITSVPEPCTAAYLGGSALLLWRRNASGRRGDDGGRREGGAGGFGGRFWWRRPGGRWVAGVMGGGLFGGGLAGVLRTQGEL